MNMPDRFIHISYLSLGQIALCIVICFFSGMAEAKQAVSDEQGCLSADGAKEIYDRLTNSLGNTKNYGEIAISISTKNQKTLLEFDIKKTTHVLLVGKPFSEAELKDCGDICLKPAVSDVSLPAGFLNKVQDALKGVPGNIWVACKQKISVPKPVSPKPEIAERKKNKEFGGIPTVFAILIMLVQFFVFLGISLMILIKLWRK